jgi:hypothetical protein
MALRFPRRQICDDVGEAFARTDTTLDDRPRPVAQAVIVSTRVAVARSTIECQQRLRESNSMDGDTTIAASGQDYSSSKQLASLEGRVVTW